MITIMGVEIDFDTTSPMDMRRYKKAHKAYEESTQNIDVPDEDTLDDEEYFDALMDMAEKQLQVSAVFLDSAFGDGIATKLLTTNPSYNKMLDVLEETMTAVTEARKEFEKRVKKYKPNKTTGKGK